MAKCSILKNFMQHAAFMQMHAAMQSCKSAHLYHRQHQESANLELDPMKFENIIESADPQLEGFFKYMINLVIPKERSAHSINEAKKSVVGLCYMMAGLRNKFVNQHKLEVGLYLMASGATWDAVDTMSKLRYSVCANTVENFQKKVQSQYAIKIEKHFTNHVIFIN